MSDEREWEDRNEPGLFADGIHAATKQNYLGDVRVIELLLREQITRFIDGYLAAKTKNGRLLVAKRVARYVANILLGRNPAYTPQHKWNEPGHVDEFCAKWLELADTKPVDRIRHAVLLLLLDVLAISEYAGQSGVLVEQWLPQYEATLQRYVLLFTGIDTATQMALQAGDDMPEKDGYDESWE